MKVTDIKQQERLKGRYSIFVDGKYTFSLSEAALFEAKIHIGLELTQPQIKDYKKLSADDKAYSLALAYVARRTRSEWEIEDYLKRKKYDEDLIVQIKTKLFDLHLVDDRKFAEAWVGSRRLLKPTSKRRLTQELRQKRVADDVIQAVLENDETDDRETLIALVERKRKQTKYQDDLKLMQYLARQGFSYNDIKAALSGES